MTFPIKKAVVLGAGGFIGGHLVRRLLEDGVREVVCIDVKPQADWHQGSQNRNPSAKIFAEYKIGSNLSVQGHGVDLVTLFDGADEVYNLAADMGGMGFIETHKLECMLTVKTTLAALDAATQAGVGRFFYASSACVYPAALQSIPGNVYLREEDAYPADPEDGYGWEKLFGERLAQHYFEDRQLDTRVARYHNVYGPHGTWFGGREKAPAAICRKIAVAKLTHNRKIDVWGDGQQTRSFMHVDDCIDGTILLTRAVHRTSPMNVGSSETVTINRMISIIEEIAFGKVGYVKRVYDLAAPQGVRGRSSDNSQILEEFGWEPKISLRTGLEETYRWIFDQVSKEYGS